jgi:hypothetical protein
LVSIKPYSKSGFGLSHDLTRVFVFSQAEEASVPQMRIGRPLGKFDLRNHFGPYPFAVFHLFLR